MDRQYRYRAFISYSHRDEKWATWLHKALETYRVPKRLVGQVTAAGKIPARLAPVFRDRDELPSATNLGDILTESLRKSANLIVICSPAAAASQWVNEEILGFKRLGRADRIFCLIVDGEPWASNQPETADQECFPRSLRHELGEDNELSARFAEPIAADARDQGDGRQNAKLKLISGLLGVGFDALKQREAQRRHRRMLLLTTAAVAGMTVTSGLAITAWLARIEAEEQRNLAQVEAETARQTAQFIVGLFKVSDPGEALGNTITAREILDKGAARIDTELADQPQVQAALMDTMGTVYQSLGLYPEAAGLLDKALQTRRDQFGPDNELVAQTMAHFAEVLSLQAKYEEAEPMYRAALETQRRKLDTEAPQVAATLVGLADTLTMDGRFDEAEPMLREALAIRENLHAGDSLEIAKSLEFLGMNQYDQGRYDEAEALLRKALAMQRRLIPEGVHPDLASTISNLALVLSGGTNNVEVEALYREALAMNRKLLENTHPTIASNLNNLAFVLHDKGDFDEAESLYRDVIEIRKQRLGDEHPEVALAMNNLAFLLYDKGDRVAATQLARDSLQMLEHLFPNGHPHLATALTNLSRWLIDAGDFENSEEMLLRSVEMQTRLLGREHPRTAVSLTELGRLYYFTERFELAVATSTEARASLSESMSPDHWRTAWAGVIEGAARARLDDFDGAESLLVNGYETIKADPGAAATAVEQTRAFLAMLYTRWGKPDQASAYLAMAHTP